MYKNLFNLEGEVIVICGAGGLIGKELVSCFEAHGADVIAADLRIDGGLFKQGIELDINIEDSMSKALDEIYQKKGRLDSWVNCAYPRTSDWSKTLEDSSLEWFNTNTEIHLGGYFNASKLVLERMKGSRKGSLINFSSIYGFLGPNFSIYKDLPMTNPVAYSAIKAGIINLSKYLATYYGAYNLRVNTISPGGVFDNQNPEFVERYNKLTPLGRMANKDEIAGSALFLAGSASTYISGHNLVVDGGWSAQ